MPIEFDFSEWDNIPSVITKFCINLDRYMKSTIQFMETKHKDIVFLQKLPFKFESFEVSNDIKFKKNAEKVENIQDQIKDLQKQINEINK